MTPLALTLALTAATADTVTIEERIDLYEPTTSAFIGSERTWFAPDGRRLRQRIVDGEGIQTLLFILLHDEEGRESGALYFEGDASDPTRESFTYSEDGRLQTTTYYAEPGSPGERTESDLNAAGNEFRKRYYRADGSQYGEEDVLWLDDGRKSGWDFRYVEREGGASFRYEYQGAVGDSGWVRRVRTRDGVPERIEVRSLTKAATVAGFLTPARFASGTVSSGRSETSPSFSSDGRTMVFARYGDDWNSKEPYVGRLGEDGWSVESLSELGTVYNLAISPDGQTIFFAINTDGSRRLSRVTRTPDGWSTAEDLTRKYGLVGSYPSATEDGDVFVFDAQGAAGPGIYVARANGVGFDASVPVYTPAGDAPFDAFPTDAGRGLLATRCFDDDCASGPRNGVWHVWFGEDGVVERKLPAVTYGWGAQTVEQLGLFVFTDGEDILALPLSVAMQETASHAGR